MMENLKEHKKVGFCGAILILRRLWILKFTKGRGTKKSILHKFRLWLGGLRPQMATFACSSAIAIAEGGEQKKGE
ncbi:unnamed protein product, partial [Musa hybrid cultivar]